MMTRRYFLTSSAIAVVASGLAPSFLARAASALETGRRGKKMLVVVFLRGAADGLNVIVPYGDSAYAPLRPTIAIPRPENGAENAAIDLDGFFALHPGLAPLKPLYDARELAVIHAVGSPDSTRSHFDAQDYMESAAPGTKSVADGWLNRYLRSAPDEGTTPFRAVAIADRMPRSLQGPSRSLVLSDLAGFQLPDETFARNIEASYAASRDPLFRSAAGEMFAAIRTLEREHLNDAAPNGAKRGRETLASSLSQLARLINAGVGLEIAFVEVGGWDHHVGEVGPQGGRLARSVGDLGTALAAFRKELGPRFEDVLVLTMTEFGRTARENGNRGTDHGHGSFMLAMGGAVRGGKVYGDWPGLRPGDLYEGRDLAVTTDLRSVFAEALERHLGLHGAASLFPGFADGAHARRGFVA